MSKAIQSRPPSDDGSGPEPDESDREGVSGWGSDTETRFETDSSPFSSPYPTPSMLDTPLRAEALLEADDSSSDEEPFGFLQDFPVAEGEFEEWENFMDNVEKKALESKLCATITRFELKNLLQDPLNTFVSPIFVMETICALDELVDKADQTLRNIPICRGCVMELVHGSMLLSGETRTVDKERQRLAEEERRARKAVREPDLTKEEDI